MPCAIGTLLILPLTSRGCALIPLFCHPGNASLNDPLRLRVLRAQEQFEEHFLNWEFYPLGVNHKRFVMPSSPLLTQFDDANPAPCDPDCAYTPGGCNCTHYLSIPFNHTVQLVLTNYGPSAFGMHPVHVHGHTFHLMKLAYPPVDPVTAKMTMGVDNADITCTPDTQCSIADWTNGQPPALNFDRPIRKDTVVVPPGGYAVIRFVSDNPGVRGCLSARACVCVCGGGCVADLLCMSCVCFAVVAHALPHDAPLVQWPQHGIG
jgi:hypothetical protein